jgi:hypothetical protein
LGRRIGLPIRPVDAGFECVLLRNRTGPSEGVFLLTDL